MNSSDPNFEARMRKRVLTVSTLAFTLLFAVWLMFGILAIPIRGEMGLTPVQFSWLVAIAVLNGSLWRLPFGILTDRIGGRRMFIFTLLLTAIPTFAISYVETYTQLLICAFALGLAGNSFSVGIAWNAAWFPRHRQGFAMGMFGAGNVGASVTKLIGPAMIAVLPAAGFFGGVIPGGWRAVPFLYGVLLVLMAAAVWLLTTKHDKLPGAGRSFGAMLKPLNQMRVWRFSLYYVVVFGAYVALSVWLPKYYQDVYGVSLGAAALLTALFIFPASLLRPLGGYFSDRFGARRVTYCVFGSMTVASLFLALPEMRIVLTGAAFNEGHSLITYSLNIWVFTALLLVIAVAMGVGKASVYKYIPEYFPKDVGAVGGLVGSLGAMGGFVLPLIFGYLEGWTGVPQTTFLVLLIVTTASLIWLHITVMRMVREVAPQVGEHFEVPPASGRRPPSSGASATGDRLEQLPPPLPNPLPPNKEQFDMESRRFHRRVPLIANWTGPAPLEAAGPYDDEVALAPTGGGPLAPRHPTPVAAFNNLRAFVPFRHTPEIDLFLDSNEGSTCPREMIATLQTIDPDRLRRYPESAPVQELWAQQLGVGPERVLLTAGGDEATDRICRTFLSAGRELILPVPTFEMLGHYPRLTGATTVQVAWPPGEPYPLEAVLEAVTERTAMIAMVSPNNPTGASAGVQALRKLSQAAPGALLLVDQAYAEFEEVGADLTQAALELPHAVVIRTLSKAGGLAGLRVGCVAGPSWIMDVLRLAGGVFPVAAPSLLLAAAALQRPRMFAAFVERVRQERTLLVSLLRSAGAEAWPSQANFVLARFADAERVRRSLASEGIAVRLLIPRWSAWDLTGCIRITCPGDLPSFERLAAALLRVLSEPVRRGA